MTVAAIHQPTFLPWLGWWDKLVRADVFVLLDDVQFPKKGGNWTNRVRVLIDGEPRWLTVPVDRSFHGVRSVRDTRIDESAPWRDKMLSTVAACYARAPYFVDVWPEVEQALHQPTDSIAELDEAAIARFAGRLDLDVSKVVRQSELGVVGTGTDLLVALCRAVDADTYLSGDGAGGYLSEDAFAAAGLSLVFQGFAPPLYPQPVPDHVSGLSIVDVLMNCGWVGTAALVTGAAELPRGDG